jgi:hypothetical protein
MIDERLLPVTKSNDILNLILLVLELVWLMVDQVIIYVEEYQMRLGK